MFIRPCYRKKNGKRHAYWALMESYRTERGPRQRVVAYLGRLDEAERLGVQHAAEGTTDSQQARFDRPEPQWVEVDTSAVRVENDRAFGGPWLALGLIHKLGLDLDHRAAMRAVERIAHRRALLPQNGALRSIRRADREGR